MVGRPQADEAQEYYFTYIHKVEGDDICAILEAQGPLTIALLETISPAQSLYRYEPGKWTIREAAGHVNDVERLVVSRAMWFARGFDTELPSFDQHVAVAASDANDRTWASLVEEFRTIRASTLTFFRGLSAEAWHRRGIASGNPFSVRACAFIVAGHVIHHNAILRERYLRPSGVVR
jgi:DinB family protein